MRFKLFILSVFFCFFLNLLSAPKVYAQTALNQGDIAFVAYNSDGAIDDFAFMLLKDISSGTTITFTDHLWQYTGGFYENASFGFCNTEAYMTWTATSALTAGTVVVIYSPGPAGSENPSEATTTTGTVFVPGSCPDFIFPPTGDVIFAYQGTKPADNSATNWLACINMDGGWLTGASTSTSASAKPTNLSDDNIIIFIPEVDNAVYQGPLSGTASTLKDAIYNLSNWASSNDAVFLLPQDIGSEPLPLRWGTFTAMNVPQGVQLNWSTLSETNTSHFEVEYATDGETYVAAGRVTASGNSDIKQQYQFTIPNQLLNTSAEAHFFRIKQVDLDDQYSYSSINTLTIKQNGDLCLRIQPSPAQGLLQLQLQQSGLQVQVYDLQGRTLLTKQLRSTNETLYLNSPAAGLLILHISDGKGRREVHKISWR